MPNERLPNKVFYEELQEGKRCRVAKRNATKTPLKPRLRISTFLLSPGNRLHRIDQSGAASSTKELHSLTQREFVNQKESAKNGKQEPMDHYQTKPSQS